MGGRTEETASSLDVDLFSVDCTMGSVDRFGLVVLLFSLPDCLKGGLSHYNLFLGFAAKIVFGSGSLFGRFLPLPSFGQIGSGGRLLPPPLSMLQVYSKDLPNLVKKYIPNAMFKRSIID